MNKIKKAIVLMIIALFAIILPQYAVQAVYGDVTEGAIWPLDLRNLKDNAYYLYCVSHGALINSHGPYNYKVVDIININQSGTIEDGNKATRANNLSTWNELNAKMAYVLASAQGYWGSFFEDGNQSYSETQMAIYYYFNEFINPLRGAFGTNDRNVGSIKANENSVITGAENYWNNLQRWQQVGGVFDDTTIKDNSGKVKTDLIKYNDTSYLKVGPLNWKYPGSISEIHINDDSVPNIKAGREANGTFIIDTCDKIIESEKPFYLLIPNDSGVSEINAKIKLSENITVYQAEMVLLDYPGMQPVIRGTGRPITLGSGDISINYPLSSGDIRIEKRDVYNKTSPISGVTFTIQHKDTGLYVAKNSSGKRIYVSSESQAERFTTNQNGDVIVPGIVEGEYIAKEVSITNQNYTNNIGKTKNITVIPNETNYTTTYNEVNPIEVSIKGKVWTPIKSGKDETSIKDTNPSTYDSRNSLLVEGIKVGLYQNAEMKEIYDANGVLVDVKMESIAERLAVDKNNQKCETYTDKDGSYEFKIIVSYPELEFTAYKVRFSYDGMDFKGCTPNYSNMINGSKAIESVNNRNALNDKYSTITGTENNDLSNGYARNLNGSVTDNLKYTFNNGKSSINGLSAGYNKDERNKRVKANNKLVNSVMAEYSLKAGDPEGNPGGTAYLVGNTVQGINLALITRESPDLATSNQIANVVTTINGYNNLYKTTLTKTNRDPDGSDLKVGVTYVTDEDELSRFTVYPSDVKTWAADSKVTDKLQVYITYKVGITNESTTLYNRVKELAIYYDNNYELQYIGNSLDANKNNYCATNEYKTSDSKYSNYNMEGYTKTCIEVNGVIGANTTKEIYMTFKVSDNEVKKMLEYSERGEKYTPKMNNVVEINAYSTYSDEAGRIPYAGIDKDSASGNMRNVNQIDDDTGIAKEFTISQSGTRTLTGTVFLDKTADELMTGEERQGNSIYNNAEDEKLKDVKVTLVGQGDNSSVNKVTGKAVTTVANNYEATYDELTDDNTYIISGFIPGNYIVKYEYNNKTYYENGNNKININAIDYKSAIVKDVAGETEVRTAFEIEKADWYKIDNPKKDGEGPFVRYNEAVDDFNTRRNIDNNYKTVNMSNTGDTTQNITTSMAAQTPLMKIAVELNTLSSDNTFKPAYYNIINMDFGITERPRQQMKLEKEVSSVKVTLANGQILMDAVIENGKLKDKVAGMKVIGTNTATQKGLIDIELDSELIHGATLEIGYTIKATNIGEIDYLEEEYYKYGTGGINKVTITPSKIVDYTSNDLTFDNTNKVNIDNKWSIVELDSIKQREIEEKGLLYTDIKGNEVKKSNVNTILQTTYWLDNKVALAPNETTDNKPLKLILTKLLSNTDEDMTYNNDVELTQATKTGGRTIVTQIGKYTFESKEGIGGSSEEITITPPTGSIESNTIYYIIATMGTLVVLAGGIILVMIRRKK